MANYPWEKSYPPGVKWELDIPKKTLHQIFEESCAQYGDRPFTDFLDKVMSFRDYKEASDKAAAGFQKLGVKPGVNVGLYLPNTPHYIVAFFGILKAGGRVVNYSPLDAARELEFKIGDSETDILVTLDVAALYPKMAAMRGKTRLKKLIVGSIADYLPWPKNWLYPIAKKKEISQWPRDDWHMSFKDLLANDGKFQSHPAPADLWDEVAVLQYTGGTTGLPKAAMLTHGSIASAMAQGLAWTAPYTQAGEEKVVCVLPLFHIYALTTILIRHLSLGNEILLRFRFDAETTIRDIAEKKATLMLGVPTMYIALLQHPEIGKRDLSSLRLVTCGGASLPVEVEQSFQKITGFRVGGGWGMTETSPAGTNLPLQGDWKSGSIGMPLPGIVMEVVALDDPRRVLGPNEKGEFRIKGPNVMKGYWKKPKETEEAFVDGYLLTGDIGYMDERGYFFLVDRKKDMIISGGFNVFPSEVEQVIWGHPAVQECAVIGVPDDKWGEAVKAVIELKPGASVEAAQIIACCKEALGSVKAPKSVEFWDVLPRTAVGKVSKKDIRAVYWTGRDRAI